MNIYAIIDAGLVVNIIHATGEWPEGVDVTALDPRPGIGWSYDGQVFTAPPPPPLPEPVAVTNVQRAALLARMTPIELHAWQRAAQRAMDTNTPVVADRNALYAWLRWESMQGTVDLTSADIIGLAQVWMALGMTQARAEEILTPLME